MDPEPARKPGLGFPMGGTQTLSKQHEIILLIPELSQGGEPIVGSG